MNWDYLAGFVDGEGTITFARGQTRAGNYKLQPRLLIGQKIKTPLVYIQDFLGVGHLLRQPGGLWVYQLDGLRKMLPVLKELQPRLLVKPEQCIVAIDYINCRLKELGRGTKLDDHCLDLDVQMRNLNKRGV